MVTPPCRVGHGQPAANRWRKPEMSLERTNGGCKGGLHGRTIAAAFAGNRPGCDAEPDRGKNSAANHYQRQPAANRCRKQVKSATFSTGTAVLESQFAYGLPAANRWRKQVKSATFSTGVAVLSSQLA